MSDEKTCTVSQYLIQRLREAGLAHMFGVPGDYVLDFMDRVIDSPIELVCTCNELNAGYAADAYARLAGIGCAAVTYGVGGYSLVNAVSGAYAEQVPMVVVSGAPHSARRTSGALVHHLTREYTLQHEMFSHITADAAMLFDPAEAPAQIDRVLSACMTQKRPGYFELPVDVVDAPCPAPAPMVFEKTRDSNPEALAASVKDAAEMLNAAKHPVVLSGIELARFSLGKAALDLVERAEIPYATTVSAKSVLPEAHPQFMGLYQGSLSREEVQDQVESADAILTLGVWLTDLDTGGFTAHLEESRLVAVNAHGVTVSGRRYDNVWMGDFLAALSPELLPRRYVASHPRKPFAPAAEFVPDDSAPVTIARFYDRINRFLDDDMIVIPDTGDSLCASPELSVEEPENFLVQAYYLSIGFAVPASLGASFARPDKRVVVLVGDEAFQMSAQELSTLIRNKRNPVIFLMNNDGLVIERLIHDGPYNEIQQWKYHQLPGVFGDGALSCVAATEGELEKALETATQNPGKLVFIEVKLGRWDCSEALARLGKRLRELA